MALHMAARGVLATARRGSGGALQFAGLVAVLAAVTSVVVIGLLARPLLAIGIALVLGAVGALLAGGGRSRRLRAAAGFAAFGLFVFGLLALGVGG